jgi:hypothetical protein
MIWMGVAQSGEAVRTTKETHNIQIARTCAFTMISWHFFRNSWFPLQANISSDNPAVKPISAGEPLQATA